MCCMAGKSVGITPGWRQVHARICRPTGTRDAGTADPASSSLLPMSEDSWESPVFHLIQNSAALRISQGALPSRLLQYQDTLSGAAQPWEALGGH